MTFRNTLCWASMIRSCSWLVHSQIGKLLFFNIINKHFEQLVRASILFFSHNRKWAKLPYSYSSGYVSVIFILHTKDFVYVVITTNTRISSTVMNWSELLKVRETILH